MTVFVSVHCQSIAGLQQTLTFLTGILLLLLLLIIAVWTLQLQYLSHDWLEKQMQNLKHEIVKCREMF